MDKLPCSDIQTNKNYFALCTAIIRQYNDDLKNIDFFIQELKKNKYNYQVTQDDFFHLQNFHTTELYELCIDYIEMYAKKIVQNKLHNTSKNELTLNY